MTDIQFLTRVTGWPVNVSDTNPLLGMRTFTAWGEIDGVKVCIQVQKRRRNQQPDITRAIPEPMTSLGFHKRMRELAHDKETR